MNTVKEIFFPILAVIYANVYHICYDINLETKIMQINRFSIVKQGFAIKRESAIDRHGW